MSARAKSGPASRRMARAESSDDFPQILYWCGPEGRADTSEDADREVARLGLKVSPWRRKPWHDGATGYRWRFAIHDGETIFAYGYARELTAP